MEHTSLPFRYDYGAIYDAEDNAVARPERNSANRLLPAERDANAAYIVQACNAYPALMSALETILLRLSSSPMGDDELAETIRAALAQVSK